MKKLFLCGVACAAFALPLQAQPLAAPGTNGVFSLPPSVSNIVAIDAHNILLIETEEEDGPRVTPFPVRHVYAGGIARLFGGSAFPTLPFVSPGAFGGGNGAGVGVTTTNGGFNGAGNGIGNTRGGAGVTRTGSARMQSFRGGAR